MFTLRKFFIVVAVILTFSILKDVSGSKILSISFMSSRSHKITYDPLLEALAGRGHNVTVVSPIPAKKAVKNLMEILTFDVEQVTAGMPNMFKYKEQNKQMSFTDLVPHLVKLCLDTLDLPQVQALRSQKFDLVLVPAIMNECALAFVSAFKTNVVLISPLSVPPAVSAMYGNPSPPSFVPNVMAGFTDHMTFYERIVNFVSEGYWRVILHWILIPALESAYRQKLGESTPGVVELLQNTSLILSNSHFSIATIRPFLPDIVEVGGMHCHSAGPLPKDLEEFVSTSGDDGFILFSMGSLLKAHTMPEGRRKVLVNVFSKLKQKVLWKWETEEMDDLPPNVKLSKWVPQQDVLGHPKIRAFITHGGFGSTTEAVYHGVPIVGLPMFADQEINMRQANNLGFGIILDFNTFTEETLLEAINQILTDSKYKSQASAISNAFRDQPNHPLDRAVYWVEYVIRHNGALHLRSAARELNFFQYHSLDVIGLIVTVLLTVVWIVTKILKLSCKFVWGFVSPRPKEKLSTTKKRN